MAKKAKKTPSLYVIIIAFFLLAAAGASVYFWQSSQQEENSGGGREDVNFTEELKADEESKNTIVVGFPGDGSNIIEAINDSGKNYTAVTTIPQNTKFVFPLTGGKKLLYVGETDDYDYGSTLVIKTILPESDDTLDGEETVIYEASEGYRIDRFVISENNEWITWYEVRPPTGSEEYTHASDSFRSFKANIAIALTATDPTQLNPTRITSERASEGTVIHLPSIITNSGDVYLDGLIPSTYSLHYGFTNENGQEIIPVNLYSSKPFLVQDRYLLYTAYTPQNTKISTDNSTSAREALLNSNTVKLFDLSQNKETAIAAPGDEGEIYKHPLFVSGNPEGEFTIAVEVYEQAEDGSTQTPREIQLVKHLTDGTFEKTKVLDMSTQARTRLLAVGENENGEKTLIIGEEATTRGNLGTGYFLGFSGYQSRLTNISIVNILEGNLVQTEKIEPSLSTQFEFIGLMPKAADQALGIDRNKQIAKELGGKTEKQLQLSHFIPIEPRRERTNPRSDCINEWEQKGYPNYEACEACPVYVYSSNVQDITVKPITSISKESAIPSLTEDEWSFKADQKGNLLFPNTQGIHKKIDFYFPRSSIKRPTYGTYINNLNYEKQIYNYAIHTGLNHQEAQDTVDFITQQVQTSQSIFLSHLSPDQAKQVLDFQISPTPDTKHTILFYVEKDPQNYSNVPYPNKQTISRGDLTVITWGAVIN